MNRRIANKVYCRQLYGERRYRGSTLRRAERVLGVALVAHSASFSQIADALGSFVEGLNAIGVVAQQVSEIFQQFADAMSKSLLGGLGIPSALLAETYSYQARPVVVLVPVDAGDVTAPVEIRRFRGIVGEA